MVASLQTRQLVRAQPFRAQKTLVAEAVAIAGTIQAPFDFSLIVSDRNQLKPGIINSLPSVGPFLDVSVFSTQIGTLDIQVAVDAGASFHSMLVAPLAIAVSTVLQVVGLRVAARYVLVIYTNTSGVAAVTDFGAYAGSV